MLKTPQIVIDDPWLEPHQEAIERRMQRFMAEMSHIRSHSRTISNHATGHQHMGIHYQSSTNTWIAREWAPEAKSIHLIGEFNGWNRSTHPMGRIAGGLWELRLHAAELAHGQKIKLHIVGADGSERDRIPSCIRRAVQDPESHDFSGQIWAPADSHGWQHDFDPSQVRSPVIYEAHVGMSGEEPRIHTYREFADSVIPRIARGGYNTIQLMAIQEHPYYGSFGYHVSSFFAPSSRFGTPEDLKYLIDRAHGAGLAVLLDIVHSHAVKNIAEGLNHFDGSGHQYFHAGERGEHPQWDSKCFDYGKREVRQFLLSNIRYWIEEFRFDGFRFDGVTSMLYHSRGNQSFGSYQDYFGPDTDEDAILYLQLATELARELKPGVLLIAEDMSGMPGLCRPSTHGGIGFTHRLAMGIPDYWIKLLKHTRDEDWNLDEMWSTLTNRRRGEATIAYAESHDQALVGDKTLAFWLMDQEMYWHMAKEDPHPTIERGLALLKMIRLATIALGGEGWLNFMGNEFGHPEWLDFPRAGNDWSYHYCRRQWSLLDDPSLKYQWLAEFDRELLGMVEATQLLSAPPARCVYIDHGTRILIAERASLYFIFNFSVDRSLPGYQISIHNKANHRLFFDTDSPKFGGHGRVNPEVGYPAGEDQTIQCYIPCRTALVLGAAP